MEPIWEGGASGQYRMLPKRKQWPNLVLEGVVALKETAFFDWFDSVKVGKIGKARADGLITLMSGDLPAPIATWTFTGAFPVKYTGPKLDTHNSLLAFEIDRADPQGHRADVLTWTIHDGSSTRREDWPTRSSPAPAGSRTSSPARVANCWMRANASPARPPPTPRPWPVRPPVTPRAW